MQQKQANNRNTNNESKQKNYSRTKQPKMKAIWV